MSEIKISTILDLIKNGNQTGFDLLYEHHYKLLFTTAFSVTKNQEDSQDIVQNVLYKLVKMPANKFPETGEVSWLYRVVKNEAINYHKSHKEHIDLDEGIEIPIIDKEITELFDMDNYNALIENLSDGQKEVVTLKVLGEYSHKEISKILGKPIGTIQWIYNTSIKKLRHSLVAMASLAFVLMVSTGSRFMSILNGINPPQASDAPLFNNPNVSHNPEISNTPPVQELDVIPIVLDDPIFIALCIFLVVTIISGILFFKFSDKLPTKPKK